MTAHDDASDAAFFALSAPPPAKRARLVEPDALPELIATTTLTTPTPPSRLPTLPVHNNRMVAALAHGVFAFLTLADAMALVQTSRLLRTDTQLLVTGVRLLPDFQRLFPNEASVVFRLPDHWMTLSNAAAQIVSTAAFLQQRVAKWCFAFDPHRPNADDDLLCSVQPVLMPLALFRDPEVPIPKWSRTPIQHALNAFCANAGDAFFNHKRAAASRFATHWDSIDVDRVTGRVVCRLCDATRDSLALYKHQVSTGLRQYELLLRCQEATWTQSHKTPTERAALTAAFHAKCFHADAYIRPECAEWPDAQLLRHICDHGKLQAWTLGDLRARGIGSVDALLRAVSTKYQHQCRSFYQPLKKSLNAKCHVIGRIPPAVLQPMAQENEETPERVLTELVGGVDCNTGIFSGVQVTFRLIP